MYYMQLVIMLVTTSLRKTQFLIKTKKSEMPWVELSNIDHTPVTTGFRCGASLALGMADSPSDSCLASCSFFSKAGRAPVKPSKQSCRNSHSQDLFKKYTPKDHAGGISASYWPQVPPAATSPRPPELVHRGCCGMGML